ncbi:MAG: SRPBCC family protein [Candidatus Binatus sp.]
MVAVEGDSAFGFSGMEIETINFFISPFPDWGIVCRVFPLGPGRIRFLHDIMVPPEAMAQPVLQEKVAIADKFFPDVNEEDVRICTRYSVVWKSRYAQRGSLGPLEGWRDTIATLRCGVARRLTM